MIPGELILKKEDIACNKGRKTQQIEVVNTGDRPIQVGSHFHFFETNKFLDFDRPKAVGMRLNIPAGTAVRFEPGEKKQVVLVTYGGTQQIHGFNNLTEGDVKQQPVRATAVSNAKTRKFKGAN